MVADPGNVDDLLFGNRCPGFRGILVIVVIKLWLFRRGALHPRDLGPGPGFIKEALGIAGVFAGHPGEVLVRVTQEVFPVVTDS